MSDLIGDWSLGDWRPHLEDELRVSKRAKRDRKAEYQAHAEDERRWAREYRQRHKKEIAERRKQRRMANPERTKFLRHTQYVRNADKVKSKRKTYREAHVEQIREQKSKSAQKQRQENREQMNERMREYYRTNSESYLEMSRARFAKRRARKAQSGGSFTRQQWIDLKVQYDNKCLHCGQSDVKLTPDHIIPVAKGGSSDISNIQPLCLPCNLSKGTKIIDYRNRENRSI